MSRLERVDWVCVEGGLIGCVLRGWRLRGWVEGVLKVG